MVEAVRLTTEKVRSVVDDIGYFAQKGNLSGVYRYSDFNNLSLLLGYRPRPFEGRAVIVANEQYIGHDPRLDWTETDLPHLEVMSCPGNHRTRLTEYGEQTGQIIRSAIDQMVSGSRRSD